MPDPVVLPWAWIPEIEDSSHRQAIQDNFDALLSAAVAQVIGSQSYAGDYKTSAQTADHGPWLICNGSAKSRSTYAALFALVGTAFGAGDGSTTFNLPNASGRALVTAGAGSGLTSRSIGASGGGETHTLGISEMPSHNHGGGAHTHVLTVRGTTGSVPGNRHIPWTDLTQVNGTVDAADVGSSGSIITSQGGGGAHNNMQPYIVAGNLFIHA